MCWVVESRKPYIYIIVPHEYCFIAKKNHDREMSMLRKERAATQPEITVDIAGMTYNVHLCG